jgi:tyrosyl-tRNA synthetase
MDNKIKNLLNRSVEEVIKKESLIKRLNSGKKLTIKLGIDPTGSVLHIGHAVVLRKLREFQDLGHKAILIVGDFTAKIGDPSGRTKERKAITDKQIKKNLETFKKQASKILDFSKTKLAYNSSWLGKMNVSDIFELASKATIAQIMERKEFRERLKQKIDVPYLEMLYPLMQGYDSVEIKADVELGGRDQKFNLLMGRQIQKRYKQKEQDIVILKLLTGTDGAKMSKSAGNYIPLMSDPNDMYGKIMSISDELIPEYTELCTDIPIKETKNIQNPLKFKKGLAKEIVKIYHGKEKALSAEKNFENVFQKGKYEESQFIETTIPAGKYKPVEIPIASGTTTSITQAKELFNQGGVEIDRQKITDWSKKIELKPNQTIKIGKKRIIKVE